jgi:predicted PurR-regulated permease PerM
MAEITSSTETRSPDKLELAAQLGGQAWRRLGLRLRSVTPASLAQAVLLVGALAALVWFVWQTWVSLVPFVVGGVIAYAALPLVNWLDRFMPRILAVLLVMSLVLLVIAAFFMLLVPILAEQLYAIYRNLPGLDEVRGYLDRAREYVKTLPEPTQQAINNASTQARDKIQQNLSVYLSSLVNAVINLVLSLVNTISFILGFVVVPTWLLYILTDQPRGKQALDRILPPWLRGDFWAVLGIFDRAFGRFIRGQLFTGLVTALLVYLGLELLGRFYGLETTGRYGVLLAMIAGITQLIPSIGPFLGVIPAVLIGLAVSVQFSLMIIVLYIIVQWIIINFVYARVERNVVDVHPAILILIIVALSQFGFWWILLATPVTAVLRDLFRYAYGRFAEPPWPAGVLPGEPLPPQASMAAQTANPVPAQRQPLVYRRQRNLGQPTK